MSFENVRFFNLCPPITTPPFQASSRFSLSTILLLIYSPLKLNSIGDRIHPCLTPISVYNTLDVISLFRHMVYCTFSWRFLIGATRCTGLSFSNSIAPNFFQSTQSKTSCSLQSTGSFSRCILKPFWAFVLRSRSVLLYSGPLQNLLIPWESGASLARKVDRIIFSA